MPALLRSWAGTISARDESSGTNFSLLAANLDVSEFRIGHDFAVDKEGAPDAGAKRHNQHNSAAIAPGSPAHFGETGRVGVVDHPDGRADGTGKLIFDPDSDPGGRNVRGGKNLPRFDDGGKAAADRALPLEVVHDLCRHG